MKFAGKKRNRKAYVLFFILPIIGWIGTGFGKYDHVRWQLAGFESQQFTVGEHDEQIEVRLNTAGRRSKCG